MVSKDGCIRTKKIISFSCDTPYCFSKNEHTFFQKVLLFSENELMFFRIITDGILDIKLLYRVQNKLFPVPPL